MSRINRRPENPLFERTAGPAAAVEQKGIGLLARAADAMRPPVVLHGETPMGWLVLDASFVFGDNTMLATQRASEVCHWATRSAALQARMCGGDEHAMHYVLCSMGSYRRYSKAFSPAIPSGRRWCQEFGIGRKT